MVNFSIEKWLSEGEGLPAGGMPLVGLSNLSKSWALAAAFTRAETPILAVFESRAEARNALDNLRFFLGAEARERVHYIPPVDFDYYRGLLPNPEVLCERNVGLFHALNDPKRRLFVTTGASVLQKVLTPESFLKTTRIVSRSDELPREELLQFFSEGGYQRQPATFDSGVFSVRGGVIDIFCPLYPKPVRLEFFGDGIEEIRFFDAQSQRSLDPIPQAYLLPVGMSLIPKGAELESAALMVKDRLDALGVAKTEREDLIMKVREGTLPAEYSFLFPLLSGGSASIFEFFPKDTAIFWDGRKKLAEIVQERDLPLYQKHHELFEKQPFPIAPRDDLFLRFGDFQERLFSKDTFAFEDFADSETTPLESVSVQLDKPHGASTGKGSSHASALESFARRFRGWREEGFHVHMVSHTDTHCERTQSLLAPYGVRSELHLGGKGALKSLKHCDFSLLHLWQGFITESRVYPSLKLVLLSEEEVFGHKKRTTRATPKASKKDLNRLLSEFRDLKENDFVVHIDYGIGRYLGLKSMNFQGVQGDYVLVEYKDGDKLYVPVYRLNVLQKYSAGESGTPIIDSLGGDRWAKAKSKAQQAVAELAAEFLKIQARRKLVPAFACSAPGADYQQFEMQFPFDETPDQLRAIEEVNQDLGQPHPMDRLLCGDVGYGKTEVAMRAAYRAVLDGKQVAILVPTTVLAFQHFENFKSRLKDSPVRVEMVSRLRSAAENKKTMEGVKDGKVDIVIGTHRLLSNDVSFKNLVLLVIDEEHRFGVVHKERLKKMSETVHVLSMTATPIPRTLNMAMTGIKDISIITTPPPDRLSVRTFVCRRSEEVIGEAIRNELARDGQVFFVHNRIEGIYTVEEELKKLFPKIRIEVVHGQMEPEELEKKMLDFYHGDFQVLLTTAIIESGLDIPRANTIIIDDADHFGIAQLYQLRGRVGRAEKRAYCYLLVPSETGITEDAKQRLQVIQRYTDLGAGFSVASHDLEIRGAGDLLGKDQSGHIAAVGVDMYFELLEDSIRHLRGEKDVVTVEPEIALKLPAFFPEEYLPDISERIGLYRRLSSVHDEDEVAEIESEIRDRFGTLPEQVNNLLGIMKMKIYLKQMHVLRMSSGPKKTSLQFAPTTPVSPAKIVQLVQKNAGKYALTPDQKLVFAHESADWKSLLQDLRHLCEILELEC